MIKFTLRIPEELHERLTAQATADRRSLNSELLHLLEIGLTTVSPETPAPLRENGHSPRP